MTWMEGVTWDQGSQAIMLLNIPAAPGRDGASLSVASVCMSCESYRPSTLEKENIVGVVLWSHKGQQEWRLHGKHCHSGYVYIQDGKTVDAVSGHTCLLSKLYKHEAAAGDFVGTGFSVKDGVFSYNSGTFANKNEDTPDIIKYTIKNMVSNWVAKRGANDAKVRPIFEVFKDALTDDTIACKAWVEELLAAVLPVFLKTYRFCDYRNFPPL